MSMTTEYAVKLFVQTCNVQRENTSKNKIVTSQKDSAKSILLEYFIQSKQSFIAIDGKYIILKHKTTKPPLNAEFIAACYRRYHEAVLKRPLLQEHEAENFARYCSSMQADLSKQDTDIILSDSRPICSLFE